MGELLALEWPDIRFLDKELGIARGYTQGVGIDTPKDNEERTVDLTPAAEAILEEWFQKSGCPEGGLVFSELRRQLPRRLYCHARDSVSGLGERWHPESGRAWLQA
jgi:integrase